MRLGELLFLAALFAIPLFLIFRPWSLYSEIGGMSTGAKRMLQLALILVTGSTILWTASLALMMLEDYNPQAKSIARNVSPGILGLINLLLCAVSLAFAISARKSSPRLAAAIVASAAFLILVWLVLAANAH